MKHKEADEVTPFDTYTSTGIGFYFTAVTKAEWPYLASYWMDVKVRELQNS